MSATVTDAHGNALAGIAVDFAVSTGATLAVVRGISDINGKAMAKATSLHAGIYTVTATVAGTSASKTMHFVGDVATASLVSVYLEGLTLIKWPIQQMLLRLKPSLKTFTIIRSLAQQ